MQQQEWIKKAIATHIFHVTKARDNPAWKLANTAKYLRRSIGSVSQDILIARWLRTHEEEIKSFEFAKDALAWIREYQRTINLRLD